MVALGNNCDSDFNVTIGLHCYCKGLVMLMSLLGFLRNPLLLPTLRSDEVLIMSSLLFFCLTVTCRSLLLFNHYRLFGLKLTFGCAAGPGILPMILTVYFCYDNYLFFLIMF